MIFENDCIFAWEEELRAGVCKLERNLWRILASQCCNNEHCDLQCSMYCWLYYSSMFLDVASAYKLHLVTIISGVANKLIIGTSEECMD